MRLLLIIFLYLFVCQSSSAQQSLNVKLLGNWNDTGHIRINMAGQRYNDVWGFVLKGKEYAVIGSTEGAHIIDIDQCKQVAFYPGRAAGPTIIHRDYKVYKHYLYAVCNEGVSTLQIFDLNYLPDSLHLVYESSPYDFMGCNKIAIDTVNATLYAGTAKSYTSVDQMRVYDISNPANPVLRDRYRSKDNIHDMFVRNDTAYCSASYYGYEIVDFTQPGNSRKIGDMSFYPYQGFNHSSWVERDGIGVMTDETFGMPVKIIDVSDVVNAHVIGTFSPRPGDQTCIPHIPYLIGKLAFVAYYFDGLQIYDISNPDTPKQVGFYDTYPGPSFSGFGGAWGCYPFFPSGRVVVSDMQTGLYILDVHDATGWPQQQNAAFSVYPNPATDKLFVSFPSAENAENVDINIYDIGGKRIFSQRFPAADYAYQPIQLTLPGNWAKGTYFVKISTGSQSHISKFTKL
ncbi:choice-of-anchor B family protein [Taibaiella soli]|uniref:Secretion system C-terminal sorting domain-containing protein n=1 Tax=Taibaiella soli TaxID=1649169 RepID=A0A2W2BM56_9BACT|nr:choice-of-anchor B family protein [Taibaiella soli]PZF74526.1 hypothetical protein DN068_02830 [Taibaiella soli]